MSTDANGPSDQPLQYVQLTYRQRVVDFTKRVAGGPILGLIIGAIFLLTGVPRDADRGIVIYDALFQWYFIPYAVAFAGSLLPLLRFLRGHVSKRAGAVAWGVELLRVATVITWLSMVFSLHDGAVIWSAGSLIVLILVAAAFKSGLHYCGRRGVPKALPAA